MDKSYSNSLIPYLMVALAAALWGTIGIFIEALSNTGFSPLEIVALRVLTAGSILAIYLLLQNKQLLKIRLKHLPYFVGTGVLSISFFNWSYFTAIRETSLSVAVILLYTGPAFVVILSRIFFKEMITAQKSVALFFTLAGAVLVVELLPFSGAITRYGIITGLGAGFGYALYSIFGKAALKKYPPFTIIFYTFVTASVAMVPFSGIYSGESVAKMADLNVIMIILGLGIFPTVLAYLLYTEGLKHLEAGKASITAMAEPVAATCIGVFLFDEFLSGLQIFGMVLVLSSVVLIQARIKNRVRV